MQLRRARILCALLLIFAPLPWALAELAPPAPEAATGWTPKQPAYGKRFMVAAAHPLAVEAGVTMLKRGGSAIDAAIATSLVLNLVEPESSGIGGGGFLLYYQRAGKSVVAYDGRETAPAEATPELFLDPGQTTQVPRCRSAWSLGRCAWPVAHLRSGPRAVWKLAWASLFQPAIRIAEEGFSNLARLAKHIAGTQRLDHQAAARAYFFHPDGTPRRLERSVTNRNSRRFCVRSLSKGPTLSTKANSPMTSQTVRTHAGNPGRLSETDLKSYRVRSARRYAARIVYTLCAACRRHPPAESPCCRFSVCWNARMWRDVAPLSADAWYRFSRPVGWPMRTVNYL
jgi:gamma-glutamyltranspeptidase/glutathione hydrolase